MTTMLGLARRSLSSGALLLMACAHALAAQHVHEPQDPPRSALRLGAHAVGLLTHISPILADRSKTEAYLTQPTLFGEGRLAGGALQLHAAISLEALTLERGELGAGNYGEGYIDRRHPHTYLHELVVSAAHDMGSARASVAIGRGFAPFGTDDPMMRPFVKFPVNHHLAQILERIVVNGALGAGPLLLEAGAFNGNEPIDAKDAGSIDRLGDSWAARVTMLPLTGVELQASHARVTSPELPSGGGADQRKWSASARFDGGSAYALAEWAHTRVIDDDAELYSLAGVLVEAAVQRGGWRPAVRVEWAQRAEDARLSDPFRTQWPHGGTHVLGITEWTIVAARIEKRLAAEVGSIAPFVEASYSHVRGDSRDLFEPAAFYGRNDIWTLNLGTRMTLGAHRARMGRYGMTH